MTGNERNNVASTRGATGPKLPQLRNEARKAFEKYVKSSVYVHRNRTTVERNVYFTTTRSTTALRTLRSQPDPAEDSQQRWHLWSAFMVRVTARETPNGHHQQATFAHHRPSAGPSLLVRPRY